MSALSESKNPTDLCQHKVPRDVCALCHPELVAKFKAAGDWCGEHGVPESQCLTCHPDLTFTPVSIPANADYKRLSNGGEDVAALEPHAVRGKVTIFDFYADWCAPCRQVDEHVLGLMKQRDDIAYRRLNLGGWETPLAKHFMANVQSLPYVVVYDKSGKKLRDVTGLELGKLDQAIADAGAR
jgi:thiol-disulfide isomerase/thioredoxin